MDTSISSLSPRYLSDLVTYHKVLAQKNNLLRSARLGNKKASDNIDVWNIQLASAGVRIMKERQSFVAGLSNEAMQIHKDIAQSELRIEYSPSFELDILNSDNPEMNYLRKLEEVKQREIENGSALYGIQRDEIKFFIDNNEAKIYASQGQQRTVVLCMKLALTEYIKRRRDEYPVLLFDDIMSELDEKHRLYLADSIRDKQVLLTCTDREESKGAKIMKIENGKVFAE